MRKSRLFFAYDCQALSPKGFGCCFLKVCGGKTLRVEVLVDPKGFSTNAFLVYALNPSGLGRGANEDPKGFGCWFLRVCGGKTLRVEVLDERFEVWF